MKKIKILFLLLLSLAILTNCSETFDNSWSSSSTVRTLSISKSQFNFSSDAQSEMTQVTAQNVPWTISNNALWLTLSPSSGSASTSVTLAVQENKTDTARHAYPMLSSTDAQWAQSYRLNVTQSASKPYINISSLSLVFDGSSSSQTVMVESNYNIDYSKTQDWLKLEKLSNGIKITVDENTETEKADGSRNDEIIVTAGTETKKISVTQRAAKVTSTIGRLDFSNAASTKELVFNAEASWTIENSDYWIQLTPTSGKAGSNTVKVSVTDNTESIRRNGFVYVNVGNNRRLEVAVRQDSTILSATPTSIDLNADGGSASFDIKSNTSWTLSTTDAWIELSRTSGDNDATVTVTVQKFTGNVRSGNIILQNKQGNVTVLIKVTQKAEGVISEITFPSSGGVSEISAIENENWKAEVLGSASWIKLNPTSGTATTKLTITASDNPSGKSRNGEVKIIYESHDYICPVVQEGKSIVLSTNSVDFFAKGGKSNSIIVTADKTPEVKSSESWLTVSQNGKTFTLTATENTTAVMRQATVSVSLPGISDLAPATITVRQAGINGTFTINGFGNDEDWN